MGFNLGNTSIGGLYVGNTKIIAAYKGSIKVFEASSDPYLIFHFTDTTFTPTVGYSSSNTARVGSWSSLGSGDWKWTCAPYHTSSGGADPEVDPLGGWKIAFSSEDSTPVGRLTPTNLGANNTVSIIGYGGDLTGIETIDRMFANCTSLTSFADIPFLNLANSSATFKGCTEVTSGAFDMYNSISSLTVPPANHSDMFANCGSNTQTGTAELARIPVSWGGTYVPAAGGTITLAVDTARKYSWTITADSGSVDFSSTSLSLDVYTTQSVSRYAGVNMRKTNISWYRNTAASGRQLYYYPCFIQCNVSGTYPDFPSWLAIAENYNGTLTSSQSSGDMPGTLDFNNFGAIKYMYGTFDPNAALHFAFMVSVLSPGTLWAGGNNPLAYHWGLLYNAFYVASTLNYL